MESPCNNNRLNNLLAQTTSITSDNSRLSDLFAQATNMMRDMGFEPPPGMNPPTEAEILLTISNIVRSESTSTALVNVLDSIQESEAQTTTDINNAQTTTAILNVINSIQGSQPLTTMNNIHMLPVASINPTKLVYIRSGDILVSTNNEDLSLLCESREPKIQLKCDDVVEISGSGNFEVLSVGSNSEKWVLRELPTTSYVHHAAPLLN